MTMMNLQVVGKNHHVSLRFLSVVELHKKLFCRSGYYKLQAMGSMPLWVLVITPAMDKNSYSVCEIRMSYD